jgi:hypothetical protein
VSSIHISALPRDRRIEVEVHRMERGDSLSLEGYESEYLSLRIAVGFDIVMICTAKAAQSEVLIDALEKACAAWRAEREAVGR